MSNEQKLIDMGAECVCGDLILNRQTVARYRNGTCMVTEAGLTVLQEAAEAASGSVEEVVTRAPRKTAKKATALPEVEEVVTTDPAGPTE